MGQNDITDSKYYTPTAEEIHVGLECEKVGYVNGPNKNGEHVRMTFWESFTITAENISETLKNLPAFRIKFLDHDDIIQCGWHKETHSYKRLSEDGHDILMLIEAHKPWFSIHSTLLSRSIFHGQIRSINELKLIMKLTHIQI